MAKKGEIVTLNLEFYPEIVNKNGRKYTQKAYDEVIDNIRKRILSPDQVLYVSYSNGFNTDTFTIDIQEVIGIVKAINTGAVPSTVDIKLLKDIDTKRKQVSLSLYNAPKITIDDLHGDLYNQYILVDQVYKVLALTLVSINK